MLLDSMLSQPTQFQKTIIKKVLLKLIQCMAKYTKLYINVLVSSHQCCGVDRVFIGVDSDSGIGVLMSTPTPTATPGPTPACLE